MGYISVALATFMLYDKYLFVLNETFMVNVE
ncbi:MAG: hypothetical protein ACI9E1_002446 [Cryomorphaceae bacterium]|jgi:hypothetical protein